MHGHTFIQENTLVKRNKNCRDDTSSYITAKLYTTIWIIKAFRN